MPFSLVYPVQMQALTKPFCLKPRKIVYPPTLFKIYWGDVNLTFGQPADTYFVIDNSARELTRIKVNTKIVVVGSLKHSISTAINVKKLRSKFLEESSYKASRMIIITFCGQPLMASRFISREIDKLAEVVSDMTKDTILIYKPHPKETRNEAASALNILKNHHGNSILNKSFSNELLFARSDLLCSCCSLSDRTRRTDYLQGRLA